ncbi:hypothetical protein [Sphingobium bisphenolivorans]|uniref:hypothetical protein n=1 Tax=Sphingobium bisphenolivorans TaxID=1335760 RepID=UPI0003A2F2CB|nr:hypothetical protein [Sphingobium bisphenolivorans]
MLSNNPPPFDAFSLHIEELIENAKMFLDGEPIATQGQADEIGKLLDMIRTAKKDADKERATEKKPHDDAAKAVQGKWKPLLDRCDIAADTAKKALVPWLEHLEAEQRKAAEKAREEAEAKRLAALEAERAAASANLEAIERVELARKEAEQAERAANRADKAKAHAAGGSRAIGLRSYWIAELVDPVAALKYYKQAQPELLKAWLLEQAQKDANAGKRAIPGCVIREDRRAA